MTLSELKDTANKLIGKSDYERIFDLLSGRLDPGCAAFSDLIQQSGRYKRVFREDMNGVVDRKDAQKEYNQINQALLYLVRELREQDLGSGGRLTDPLEKEAARIAVQIPLTPLHIVNCDRKKAIRAFWKAFDEHLEQKRCFQFYYLPCCPTQQPESFCERTVYEILEKELENQYQSFDFRRRPDGERLLIEPLPVGRNLGASQKAFKKYFADRFGLHNSDTAFEEYLQTGLPKLPWQYLATSFKVTPDDWDEDFLPEYLAWIMDTFSQTGEKLPTFLFFFLVVLKNAHQPNGLHSEDRTILNQIQIPRENRPLEATLIEPLPPVAVEDLEYWLEKIADVGTDQKQRVVDLISARLKGDEMAQFVKDRAFNMERIEEFQLKIYHAHK
jgi:hypothetical protein